MASRLELHEVLCDILGSRHVYYQPPESVKMVYPAIVYSKNSIDIKHGDDLVYRQVVGYSVTLIDKDPDSEFVDKIMQIPMCRFDRHYAADNLNHDVFTIYY